MTEQVGKLHGWVWGQGLQGFSYYTFSCNYSVNLNDFQIKRTGKETRKIKNSVFSRDVREKKESCRGCSRPWEQHKGCTVQQGNGQSLPKSLLLALLCLAWQLSSGLRPGLPPQLSPAGGGLTEGRGAGCSQLRGSGSSTNLSYFLVLFIHFLLCWVFIAVWAFL